MPNLEPEAGGSERVRLRHIGPRAAVFQSSPAANVSFLARSDMVARPLPSAEVPGSPDWVSGTETLRLDDAGEMTLVVPNEVASDGIPWNQRFDTAGHLGWLEIYTDGELDQVCVIDQTPQTTPEQVAVHASDAWWLLKKAYERDWIVVQSPRDVIERATQLWVPVTVDNFPAGALNAQWTPVASGVGSSVTVAPSGGLALAGGGGGSAQITSPAVSTSATRWTATCTTSGVSLPGSDSLGLEVIEGGGGTVSLLNLYMGTATLQVGSGQTQVQIATSTSYSLLIESDGEWISGFVNGQFVGTMRRGSAGTSLQTRISISATGGTSAATVTGVLVEALQPFLQRSSDKGDYVLPGTASTYPSGGLHARYFNDTDLQADGQRLLKIHAPSRTQAYGGSGVSEYANQQDATINGQANPTPGAAASNWSAIWFGAIYLKASAGNYSFQIVSPGGATTGWACRVWIGQTQFGQQLGDAWTFSVGSANVNMSPASSIWAGTLPYGAGTVVRDGWYPIKIEWAVDSTPMTAPQFKFQPPTSYTDPGGTALTGGALVVVPATSLSPLGCVDQRYQGVSHFDLVQQTIQAFGYQASVEPQTLESGSFPGVLAPRIREGHDTDMRLKPDRGPRQDGNGLTNYSSGLDATDFASSLQGNGAGIQNGGTGQLQSIVYDPATLNASLFDAQAWQDFSDAGFPSLLQALLNSQLGLRLQPWQVLQADPTTRNAWAHTWPLPGSLAKMRWRPGDGVLIDAPEINVVDTSPRQMLVVTRNFTSLGITGAQATFANRPRTPARALKQQLYSATRWQRNYQRQLVRVPGSYQDGAVIAAGGANLGPWSMASLSPGDNIERVQLRIAYITGTAPSIGVETNAAGAGSTQDVTITLNGPFVIAPINLDITSVAFAEAGNRIYVALINKSVTNSVTVSYQVLVDVQR